MKAEPATTKRSKSKRSQRDASIPTNHDLLRLINNRAAKSKSSLEEGFPVEPKHTHQKSRPSLIERKHHENLPEQFNQQTIVRVHSLNNLIGSLERLLNEQDFLPIVKRKVREAMQQLQAQLTNGIKRLERLVEAESNSRLNQDKLSKDLTRLQKKVDCGRQTIRKLDLEKESLARKVDELERKLESQIKSTVATSTTTNQSTTHNTSVHNSSVNGGSSNLSDEKKLRNIVLGQSQVINEQITTIESHRQEFAQAKLHTEQLYHMMLFQASTVESLLPTLNKYSDKRFH